MRYSRKDTVISVFVGLLALAGFVWLLWHTSVGGG
jgi:hypothetical protein